MAYTELESYLLALARDALEQAQTNNNGPARRKESTPIYDQLVSGQGGTAFFNPMRDARITGATILCASSYCAAGASAIRSCG
jgi:hypothetical protein